MLIVAAVGVGIWFATMPYPARVWWEAQFQDHYSEAWPISREDYAEIMHIVRRELEWREIVVEMEGVRERNATVRTVAEASGAYYPSGKRFYLKNGLGRRILLKKVSGRWMIAKIESYSWVS